MRLVLLIAVVLFVSSLAAPVRAGMAENCVQDRDPDLRIGGCTAVIRSGKYSGENLAVAYNNRGIAYYNLGEHRRAIEDYDQSLRIDPGFAKAYYNRGTARCHVGLVEASIDDRMQALRLGAIASTQMQILLSDLGFYKGAIDGDFGPASRKALRGWTAAGCPRGNAEGQSLRNTKEGLFDSCYAYLLSKPGLVGELARAGTTSTKICDCSADMLIAWKLQNPKVVNRVLNGDETATEFIAQLFIKMMSSCSMLTSATR